jgi:hypothetical protein
VIFVASSIFHRRGAESKLYSRAATLCLTVALVLSPWIYRNHQVFGAFPVLSTNGGMNLLLGNNPSARGGYTRDDPVLARIDFSSGKEAQADSAAAHAAAEWIVQNPRRFLMLLPAKFIRLWVPDGEAVWVYQSGHAHYDERRSLFLSARYIDQAYYFFLISGFLAAPIVWRRLGGTYFPEWTVFGYGLAAYITILALITFGDPRFHFPVMPFAALHCSSIAVLLFCTANGRGKADDDFLGPNVACRSRRQVRGRDKHE